MNMFIFCCNKCWLMFGPAQVLKTPNYVWCLQVAWFSAKKIFDTVRNFCLKLRLEISTSNLQMTFKGSCSGSGIIPTLDLGEGGSFYDIWNKMVKRLPSWQRSGVVSQQRLRLRLLTLVKRVSKLWFELIWFLFAILFFEGSLNALGRWKCLLLQRSEFWWKD